MISRNSSTRSFGEESSTEDREKGGASGSTDLPTLSSSLHSGNDTKSAQTASAKAKEQDRVEVLVEQDNRRIRIVRFGVFLLMMVSVALTSFFIYDQKMKAEEKALDETFTTVANKLVVSTLDMISLKYGWSRTAAAAVEAQIRSAGDAFSVTNFSVPQEELDGLSFVMRHAGKIATVSWSPLLKSDEERLAFEDYASGVSGVETIVEEYPPCYLCGTLDEEFINPLDSIDVPGYGIQTCLSIAYIALSGVVPPPLCPLAVAHLEGTCICGRKDDGQSYNSTIGDITESEETFQIPEQLYTFTSNSTEVSEPYGNPPYLPVWSGSALIGFRPPIMFDHMSIPMFRESIKATLDTKLPSIAPIFYNDSGIKAAYDIGAGSRLGGDKGGYGTLLNNSCLSFLYYPVVDGDDEVIGVIVSDLGWTQISAFGFPTHAHLLDLVIENSCGQFHTFKVIEGSSLLQSVGEGDLHDHTFDEKFVASTEYSDYEKLVLTIRSDPNQTAIPPEHCLYRIHAYATEELMDEFLTEDPITSACIAAGAFLFTSLIFVVYDLLIGKRQRKIMKSAKKSNVIVESLFPENVRDRLYDRDETGDEASIKHGKSQIRHMYAGLKEDALPDAAFSSEPIADLFASATVGFIDIAGFTAWSSEREPSQVFKLLEAIYNAFDKVANKYHIFKIETIGDSYVAVCGVPEYRRDHALLMTRFAQKCLVQMSVVTKNLERYLGPSTGDLQARVGLHSGPVTAGVLRGDKARFQLFGDTVNTASRVESTGIPGRILVTKETADLLIKAGKEDWVVPRRELVTFKGKGKVQTYLIFPTDRHSVRASITSTLPEEHDTDEQDEERRSRLVDWNFEILSILLQRLIHSRDGTDYHTDPQADVVAIEETYQDQHDGRTVIDDMIESVSFPEVKPRLENFSNGGLEPVVAIQLHLFVSEISKLYRDDVPFHNFEHVSHVVMGAFKLMKRIVIPDEIDYKQNDESVAQDIHENTYGISSDPLLHFAIVFSSLIHDVGHNGLTNTELIELETEKSVHYKGKSVAEQNSVELAWRLLLQGQFKDLRASIYGNVGDLVRFRQLVVNSVMATDIADKQLKDYREKRWDHAFQKEDGSIMRSSQSIYSNRKATIVFEYIIQAADVCHTMQHWHTYQRFNKRLFEERYVAWLNGHLKTDPSLDWYRGEIWFFDNYIIPMAEKLYQCGVFGVSYHELVTYANENKREWESKGVEIVEEMKAACEVKFASGHPKNLVG